MNVHQYIIENWQKTIRDPSHKGHGIITLPKPFTTPSIEEIFEDFYYWDTYFINVGLLTDGFFEQAKNNIDNIAYLIRNLGYMPNASHLHFTSQPPLFTRAVFDYWRFSKDDEVLKEYFDAILQEYTFFSCDRNTKIKLNQYGCVNFLKCQMGWLYNYITNRYKGARRVKQSREKDIKEYFSIAESGWDATPRFSTSEATFAPHKYVQVDLNSLIFDMEMIISQIYSLSGDIENSKKFHELALRRKDRMNKYMRNSDNGIYYDYNFIDKKVSPVVSAVSFYPYVYDITTDKKALEELLKRLELEFGLSACEKQNVAGIELQWDYPIMWAPNAYFAHEALLKNGMAEDAKRIAEKYMQTIRSVFEKEGILFEKYNAKTGTVASTKDSASHPMLGWTGGIYSYFYNFYYNDKRFY